MCGARQERWKSGWWNEWRSREKEQRIDVIDVIWLVFISLTYADCSVHAHIRVCMRALACVTNGSEIFIDLMVLPRTSFTIRNLALLFAWHTLFSLPLQHHASVHFMSPFFPFPHISYFWKRSQPSPKVSICSDCVSSKLCKVCFTWNYGGTPAQGFFMTLIYCLTGWHITLNKKLL